MAQQQQLQQWQQQALLLLLLLQPHRHQMQYMQLQMLSPRPWQTQRRLPMTAGCCSYCLTALLLPLLLTALQARCSPQSLHQQTELLQAAALLLPARRLGAAAWSLAATLSLHEASGG
jgi:hypothetical protein